MSGIELSKLIVTDHFVEQCCERAPHLVIKRKDNQGGGFVINTQKLESCLIASVKVERQKSISRLLRYGHGSEYYHYDKVKVKNQLIFVVEKGVLVTVYRYLGSWVSHAK